MSVHAILWCDGPRCPATFDAGLVGQGHASLTAALRREAAERGGWLWMRPDGARRWGDYCPRCVAGMRAGAEIREGRAG